MPFKLVLLGLALAFVVAPSPVRARRADAFASAHANKARPTSAPSSAKPESSDAEGSATPTQANATKASDAVAVKPAAKLATKDAAKKKREAKPKPPCFAPEVHVVRKRGTELEHRQLSLTFCDGAPNPAALDSLSVLARPRDVERPLMPEIKAYQRRAADRGPRAKRRDPAFLSEHVMRVHPGLLERLQKIANRFRGKTIEVISGHRPDARDTSRHHHGRALDLHVEGVSREVLRDFARTLDDTGVGYYPNGYFVHVDVRDGKGYWVDRSGPGEPADYGPWPPREDEIERTRKRVIDRALAELSDLEAPVLAKTSPARAEEGVADAPRVADENEAVEPTDEEDDLTREEVARIRAEALEALEAL